MTGTEGTPEQPQEPDDVAAALRRILDYVDSQYRQTQEAMSQELPTADRDRMLEQLLTEGFIADEEAIDMALSHETADEQSWLERSRARRQYYPDLQRLGIDFDIPVGTTFVGIVDLPRFSSAVRRMELTGDRSTDARLLGGLISLTDSAFMRISHTIEFQNPEAYANAAGERAFGDPAALPSAAFLDQIDTIDRHLTNRMHQYAPELARDFENLGLSAEARMLRLYHIAHNEGLDVPWAAAYNLELLDNTYVGTRRLSSPEQWQSVFNLLGHLQQTAPGASFTRQLRHKIIRDIHIALEQAYSPGQINPESIPGSQEFYDKTTHGPESSDTADLLAYRASADEQAAREQRDQEIVDLLHVAERRVRTLIPPPAPASEELDTDIANITSIGEVMIVIASVQNTLAESAITAAGVRLALTGELLTLQSVLEGATSPLAISIKENVTQAASALRDAQDACALALQSLRRYKV